MASKIPIQNIYYMLTYAYDILKQGDNAKLGNEGFDNVYDLYAKILVNGLNHIIKRGFHREYISKSDELPVLRGKLALNETIKRQTFILGKLQCEFDEMSINIIFNQIVKATIEKLIKYKELDHSIRSDLIKVNRYLVDIDVIRLQKYHFSQVRFNRNNNYYKMLIDICELLYDCQLVNTQNGQTLFKDFIMDQRMAMLYEKFILNFYKKELVTNKVYSPHINWDLDRDYDHYGINLLPIMRTDIVIENGSRQLIIDAKYYSSALQSRNLGGTKKLISSNLYQIYTYLNNSKFNGDISGMLLYPVVDTELDLEFSIQGKVILVKTLNLDTNWSNIKKRLLDIIF